MNIELANVIKELVNNTTLANKPTTISFGVVTNEEPIEITIDQKLRLTKEFLILTRNVTDYDVDMTVNHTTEKMQAGGKDPSFKPHKHAYKGRKKFKVHNRLLKGENVLMLRMQGGQKYIVIDRI